MAAPVRKAKIADAREKNSMSITVSMRWRRTAIAALQEIDDERRQRLVADADDVGGRHGADHVEDGAVALEDAEKHVVAADGARRARDRVLREDGGALLDEFQEQDL